MIRLAMALISIGSMLPDVAPNPVPRVGETIAPRKSTAVEMSAETVRIWLQEDTARVEASFVLRNTGAEKEVLEVGFPTAAQPKNYRWNSREGMQVTEWGPSSIMNFTATVDGQAVKPAPKTGTDKNAYQGWMCWAMSFDGNQKRDVKVAYTVNSRDDNYSEPSCLLNRQVTYILKTGAGWKGNIGEATIILDLGGMTSDNILRTAPDPTEKGTSTWTWTIKDFEPNADILVQYRFYASSKEAVAKLEEKLKKNGSDNEALIDYAENLLALEQPLRAAEAFAKLHDAEKKEGNHFWRHRTEYQPPAYRAAKCYREAGRKDETREWAKKAVDRLEEVSKEHPIVVQKSLRTNKDKLAKAIQECRDWAAE
jgi:hypothetical protein